MTDARKKLLLAHLWQPALVLASLLIAAIVVVACNSGGPSTSGMATVSTSLSDPATCAAPDGPYAHVYVTITDVQVNTSSTAGATDSGWVDLTPNLSGSPKQVDLLGQANNQCFLAMLGDNLQLQAGSFQQIRLILANNSATVASNACGTAANCVVLTSDSSVHTLQLSSESQTGIKIPSGQIASGAFTISAGQTKDLNIDFNTCESIVQQGNGQYLLKPVLHAGEVSTTSSSINGTVLDSVSGNPVGKAIVALETKDSNGVDRIYGTTATTAADGTFVFCPLAQGTYDVVIVGSVTSGSTTTFYEPAIVTGVSAGSTIGTVKLNPPTSALAAVSSANLGGQVTSVNTSNAGIAVDVALSVLETVSSTQYTVPLPMTSTQSMAWLMVQTAATSTTSPACPSGAYCADYTMQVPSGGAYIGAWASGGATLTQPAPLATYMVDGMATTTTTTATPDCSLSDVQSNPPSALSGTGPFTTITVPTIAFTSCQ